MFRWMVTATVAVQLLAAGSVQDASVELVRPGVYKLEYRGEGKVQVFADTNPDKISAAKALLTIRQSPTELQPSLPGRVYFHLKPERGAVVTVATRALPLEGAANFRDLGGYRTADGKSVRWGRVYRSNNLANLTEADYKFLESVH